MKIKNLQKYFLENPEQCRELILTDHKIGVFNLVKDRKTLTANELAVCRDITIQNASQQLRVLWEKGYLKRVERSDDSGGYCHEYSSDVEV